MEWLASCLIALPRGFVSMYASHPWLCFWGVHALELLNGLEALTEKQPQRVIKFLASLQHPDGGLGGGYLQAPHSLATYSGVAAMVIVGAKFNLLDEVFASLDVEAIKAFCLRMKISDKNDPNYGGFRACESGEVDTRTIYSCLAVASMLDFLDEEMTEGCAEWLSRCQTYEGGMGGEPGTEAHGGYVYCGLASALLLQRPDCLDLDRMLRWAANMQFALEGGFCGRTQKLVDGCYSFWIGGLFPMLHYAKAMVRAQVVDGNAAKPGTSGSSSSSDSVSPSQPPLSSMTSANLSRLGSMPSHISASGSTFTSFSSPAGSSTNVQSWLSGRSAADIAAMTLPMEQDAGWLFDQLALQRYVVLCSQKSFPSAGLRDKPSKSPDLYHTCYCLSGLSIAQHSLSSGPIAFAPPRRRVGSDAGGDVDVDVDIDDDDDDEDFEVDDADLRDAADYSGFGKSEKKSDKLLCKKCASKADAEALRRQATLNVSTETAPDPNPHIFGPKSNLLVRTNPIFNISDDALASLIEFLDVRRKRKAENEAISRTSSSTSTSTASTSSSSETSSTNQKAKGTGE